MSSMNPNLRSSRAAATLLALALGALLAHPVYAAEEPSRTTATYDAWTLRCVTPAGSTRKSCEIFQAQQSPTQRGPVSQLAIGRADKKDPLKMVLQVPPNVWLGTAPKITFDDGQAPIALALERCLPAGCFAETGLADDVVKKLRARTAPGRIEYEDGLRRRIASQVSFDGISAALDALAKE
ncbi:hypothetical protein A33M_0516 [Rhodovulum sp. PH10]|uniref:invasion associated locus B family protein n=1 Tax=Rhodovulum sp. PH10 TaxID=1187851 RepID=UPI00027C2ABB|nr:invasion associated locus B family protein [Rhodovulum sp. PH10]EJW10094.1 hypothetical protein A33M_0516 [Rhodovulum sp. PH10]